MYISVVKVGTFVYYFGKLMETETCYGPRTLTLVIYVSVAEMNAFSVCSVWANKL